MTTWSFWSGPKSPAIELCLESIAWHNPDFVLVDGPQMQQFAPDLFALVAGRSPQVRSDLFRLWLLAEFGGQWIDADCIALQRLDMHEQLGNGIEMVAYSNNNGTHVSNNVLAASPGGLAAEALRRAVLVVQSHEPDERIQYGATGQGVLGKLRGPKLKICQRFRWAPVRYTDTHLFQQRRHDGEHRNHHSWHPNARAYHFTGKGLQVWEGLTREQILASPTFASFLLRRSLGRVKPLRAQEILRRVPANRDVLGCEVGVHQGNNAATLLQQRPRLTLLLVDLWGAATDSYRKSGDAIARRSNRRRELDLATARRTVAFAAERAEFRRGESVAMAEQVADGSLDFVFIDADHSEAGCAADIDAWISKVKPGGWIGGHDYGHRLESGGKWGVKRAVDAAAKHYGLKIETGQDLTWFATDVSAWQI